MHKRPATPLLLIAALAAAPALAAGADGQTVYEKSCGKCHNTGPGSFFTGAPRIGTDAWKTRLAAAGSVDALVKSVATGKGKMPAQGGASGLSDADLEAAVGYILSRSTKN